MTNLQPEPTTEFQPLLPPSVEINGTRRRLLESALELFAEFGYHGVTVKEIAERAGIQAGSVYVHFSSKEMILSELMMMGHIEHRDRLREALRSAGPDPVARLRGIVIANVKMHATHPLLATIAHKDLNALSSASLQKVLEVRGESERMLVGAVERGVEAGVFTYPNPFLGAAAIGGMAIRVAAWYRPGVEYASRYTVDEVAEAYADFAVKLLT